MTGHVVFDLGQNYDVNGALLTARNYNGSYAPSSVEFYYFADHNPYNNTGPLDDIEGDSDIISLGIYDTFFPSMDPVVTPATDKIYWSTWISTRFVGMRINDSHSASSNFHLGEVNFQLGKVNLTPDMPFFWGMYANVPEKTTPDDMAALGISTTVFFNADYYSADTELNDATLMSRLDAAKDNGLNVILHLDGITNSYGNVTAVNTARLTEYVNKFKDHPAVIGWYSADEPSGNTSRDNCQIIYDTVKALDSRNPVYLNVYSPEVVGDFAPTCDRVIFDKYLWAQGEDECYAIEDHGSWFDRKEGLRSHLDEVASNAATEGKPWYYAIQGYGRREDSSSRLPTRTEHRWATYYSLLKGASGTLCWEYDHAIESEANAGDPYPNSGTQWLTEVFQPLAEEIDEIGAAIAEGEIVGGISDNKSGILSEVYKDLATGEYYLVALNNTDDTLSSMFTINLSGNWIQAYCIDGGYTLTCSGGQFVDCFDNYQVRTYRLIDVPEPASLTLILSGLVVFLIRSRYCKTRV